MPILDEERKLTLDTSFWCLKRFYEDLKDLHKTFWDTTKKCENKNLSFYFNTTSTVPVPISGEEKKINLNLYFHTSLWCGKRFYEGLKGPHKTFWGTTKKCESKNLS